MSMILILLLAAMTFQNEIPITDHQVLSLNKASLDKHLHNNEFLLVLFYRQKSNISKHFKHEFEHALTILRESECILAQIDATHHKQWIQTLNITKLPHIIFFKKEEIHHYKHLNLTSKKLVSWAHKLMHPEVQIVNNEQELKNFMRSSINGTFLIANGEKDSLIKEFKYIVQRYPMNIFAIIQADKIQMKFTSQIINFQDQGKSYLEFQGDRTTLRIQYFIETMILSRPVKYMLTPWLLQLTSRFERNIIILFDREQETTSLDNFVTASQLIPNETPIFFIHQAYSGQLFGKFFELAGNPHNLKSGIAIIGKNGRHRHVYKHENIESSLIIEFINDYFSEKLHFFKNKKGPHIDNAVYYNPIILLHGDEFEEKIKENKKITLAIYYNSQDQDQTQVLHQFQTLAKQLNHYKKFQVFAVDLRFNDVDHVHKSDTPCYKLIMFNEDSGVVKVKNSLLKADKLKLNIVKKLEEISRLDNSDL